MNSTKTCSKCGISKPLDEFHKSNRIKDGKGSHCKECDHKKGKKYRENHKREKNKKDKIWYENIGREERGHLSMHENKLCSLYLGIVIAERLCRHLFKDVQVMPMHNPGYDFICNKGKKIDVKSSCITLNNNKTRCKFHIGRNKTADFFILVAFDNLTDLNPLHLWMIPGKEINHRKSKSIRLSVIHKWDKWKRDIEDAQLCCAEMKEREQTGDIN